MDIIRTNIIGKQFFEDQRYPFDQNNRGVIIVNDKDFSEIIDNNWINAYTRISSENVTQYFDYEKMKVCDDANMVQCKFCNHWINEHEVEKHDCRDSE
jgi:hypothetical protein